MAKVCLVQPRHLGCADELDSEFEIFLPEEIAEEGYHSFAQTSGVHRKGPLAIPDEQ